MSLSFTFHFSIFRSSVLTWILISKRIPNGETTNNTENLFRWDAVAYNERLPSLLTIGLQYLEAVHEAIWARDWYDSHNKTKSLKTQHNRWNDVHSLKLRMRVFSVQHADMGVHSVARSKFRYTILNTAKKLDPIDSCSISNRPTPTKFLKPITYQSKSHFTRAPSLPATPSWQRPAATPVRSWRSKEGGAGITNGAKDGGDKEEGRGEYWPTERWRHVDYMQRWTQD